LKDEADLFAAQRGHAVGFSVEVSTPSMRIAAAGRLVDAADQVEEGSLAASAGAGIAKNSPAATRRLASLTALTKL
jgi:hypothetical protein